MKKQFKLLKGNNLETLKQIPDNSIDSIVTDPPYGLSFMNKKWDYDVPSVEFWQEAYRVLKPGGHILSFGGTRTYHRMVVNIEDAGFEIRDQIMWIYGSGFPKSHNIGKAVDKRGGESISWFGDWLKNWRKENNIPQSKVAELFPSKSGGKTGCVSNWELGFNLPTNEQFNLICKTFNLPFNSLEEAEREFIGTKKSGIGKAFGDGEWNSGTDIVNVTKGNSEYEGWGTALKPANEPICVARKPLSEKTVADNVLKWGTGGINIDGCRIGNEMISSGKSKVVGGGQLNNENTRVEIEETFNEGRFPANIIFECICDEVIKGENKGNSIANHKKSDSIFGKFGSDIQTTNYNDTADIHTNPNCPCFQLDEQSGISKSVKGKVSNKSSIFKSSNNNDTREINFNDKGGASRFFYVAKVSKKERNLGLDSFEDKEVKKTFDGCYNHNEDIHNKIVKNSHPTLKPIKLMSYLIRLVTPENGICLDPFMGSGSTGIAAMLEGKRFVGCELDEEYFKIAEKRIEEWQQYKQIIK